MHTRCSPASRPAIVIPVDAARRKAVQQQHGRGLGVSELGVKDLQRGPLAVRRRPLEERPRVQPLRRPSLHRYCDAAGATALAASIRSGTDRWPSEPS